MVTKRGLGSGLLKHKEKIDALLTRVSDQSDISISLKMRLGYENRNEIIDLLPMLEKHKIKNMVIHPRLGRQLYKGEVDLDLFQRCINNTSHQICYNGDIDSMVKFRELRQRFPSIKSWALGRGIIANPFLAEMIQSGTDLTYSFSLKITYCYLLNNSSSFFFTSAGSGSTGKIISDFK
jgi:tRNA-dihydrouridine synthase